jgi:hypothetical protein
MTLDTNYSIEIYIGEVRSGKTLTMVAETYEQLRQFPDVKVFSNIHLKKEFFPTYEYITREDIINYYKRKIEFQNAIFLIDELHIFADARKFGRKENMSIGYWVGQMGKRGNTLRGTTHFMNLVDIRIRLYCERKVFITKGLIVGRRWMPILNNNRILTDRENEFLCIKAEAIVRKMINYDFYHVRDSINYIMAKRYFPMYDTHELVFVGNEAEEKEKGEDKDAHQAAQPASEDDGTRDDKVSSTMKDIK